MIAGNALRARIENDLAIHEKAVVVMAVGQRHLQQPGAIGLPFHRMRGRIPVIEISHQEDLLCFGSETNEIDGFGHFFGRITIVRGKRTSTHVYKLREYTAALNYLKCSRMGGLGSNTAGMGSEREINNLAKNPALDSLEGDPRFRIQEDDSREHAETFVVSGQV